MPWLIKALICINFAWLVMCILMVWIFGMKLGPGASTAFAVWVVVSVFAFIALWSDEN